MKQGKIHYAWVILLACILIQIGSLGGIGYSFGIYYVPVCTELGVGRGDLALAQTICSLVSACVSPIVGKILPGKDMGKKMALAMVGVAVCYAAQSQFTSIWQWYISNALLGAFSAFIYIIPVPILISNWFHKGAGTALGIAMCSGIGGTIMTQIGTRVIAASGWRAAYLVIAAICTVIVIPTALLLVKYRPEDMGMKPYGADESYELTAGANADSVKGVPYSVAIKSKPFFIMFVTAGLMSATSVYYSHMPSFAVSKGWSTQAGANLASVLMVSSMAAKLLLGQLNDRLGIHKAAYSILTTMTIGFAGVMLLSNTVAPLYVAVILISFGPGIMSLAIPMVARSIFGSKDHGRIFGFITMGSSLLSAINSSAIGYIYDFTGSYLPAFGVGICLCVLSIVGIAAATKESRKRFPQYFEDAPEPLAE